MQETLQRRKQKGAEPAFVSISRLKKSPFEHLREKLLSEILGVRNGVALPADESENWSPVDCTELGKCSVRLSFIGFRVRAGQNDAPPCRHEPRLAEAINGGFRFHRRRPSHLPACDASLGPAPQPAARGAVGVRFKLFSKLRPEKSEL